MRKILIFYGSYGGGHLSAAKSIKSYIEENYSDTEILMVDCIEYINKVLNKLTTKAYSDMAKKAPWLWKKVYKSSEKGALSKISSASNKLMTHKLSKLIIPFNPDLIISTHPFSSQMCTILKKKKNCNFKLATIMTDFAVHSQWLINHTFVDYFFVAQEKMKSDMLNLGIPENKIFVTGIPVSQKFFMQFDKVSLCNDLGLDINKKIVLFFAGGEYGLGQEKNYKILECFASNFPDIQVLAIAGKNEKMKMGFEEIAKNNPTIKVFNFITTVPEFMSISDLAISKPGGLTSSECLHSNLPILIINPIPGQEEENAEFLVNSGVGIWLKSEDNILEVLSRLFNSSDKLDSLNKKIRTISNNNPTKDICEKLLK